MRSVRYSLDGGKLLSRIKKALVTTRNIVVYLDAEHTARFRLTNDSFRIAFVMKSPGSDARVVGPVLIGRILLGLCSQQRERYAQYQQ